MKIWSSPAGDIKLKRYPFAGDKSHQAWDAADEWIVGRFPDQPKPVLISGEAFGVLAAVWGKTELIILNDSLLSLKAADENRKLNPESSTGRLLTPSLTDTASPKKTADRIFIRLPKSLELLDVYIKTSLEYADADTEIWLGGMDKRWNRGVKKLTDTLLEIDEIFSFERHARWIRYRINASPPQKVSAAEWDLERYPISINPAPAVFSSAGMDPGTAAFVEAYPEARAETAEAIVDLGCGSGILGLCAAYLNPEAKIFFTDESALAVKNAESNFTYNKFTAPAEFLHTNGAGEIPADSIDLVLCNPPFHYQNIQTREPAEFLFGEALRILKQGGMIQIVGNNHLGYHKLLKKYFPNATDVYRGPKFTVLRAEKKN